MKTSIKRIISVILTMIMLMSIALYSGLITASAASKHITSYSVGDIVDFGYYPQSKVTDSGTVSVLNGRATGWQSYGYMSGAGTDWKDGSAQKSDYMKYCDVSYNGKWYRGVKFDTYRSFITNNKSTTSTSYAYQADNGYYINNTYWFEYEPLHWRVLDPRTGLVLCEEIIDSQPYSDTLYYYGDEYYKDKYHNIYANNYYESSIRAWLNDDFYNTAFTDEEKAQINKNILRENKCYNSSFSKYDSTSSKDAITLLTYQDVRNTSYGFSCDESYRDINRRAHSTDYAKCQGCYTYTGTPYKTANGEDTSDWRLRSAGHDSNRACDVYYNGSYFNINYFVIGTDGGVRPAFNFNLSSVISSSLPSAKSAGANGDMTINFCDSVNAVEWNRYITDKNGQIEYSLKNVNVKYNGKTAAADNQIKLSIADAAKTGAALSKSGYENYIIPKEYFESYSGYIGAVTLDAYMNPKANDGKPYVSTVFGKKSGTGRDKLYADITRKTLYVDQSKYYDIIISAQDIGADTTYYIFQDDSHKISNNTGKFSNQELYSKFSYDTSKKTYAYVISNGKTSEPVEIKLKKVLTEGENTLLNSLDDGDIKILGDDGLSFTLSGTGFIDGMEFSLDAFKNCPIGFEKNENTYRISLGIDIFGANKETKGSSTTGTKWKKDWEYQGFVSEILGLKKETNDKEKTFNLAESIKKKYDKSIKTGINKNKGWDVSLLGYLEFEVVEYDDGSVKPVIKDFCGVLTGKVSYTYNQQGFVWVIPEYTYFAFEASIAAKINRAITIADSNVPIEFNVSFDFGAGIKVGGGIGFKDLLSAGFWGSANFNAGLELFGRKHTYGNIVGEFGYEAKFLFIFGTQKTLLSGTLNLWDTYLGGNNSKKLSLNSLGGGLIYGDDIENTSSAETELAVADRAYLKNTSAWLADKNEYVLKPDSVSADGISFTTLQKNVFEYSQAKVINANGKLVMVFVEDDASRDTYNRMRLMSTVYNPSTDSWSTPTAVYDDGCNDAYPSLVSDGKNVYVAWQKIAKKLTASDCETASALIQNSEIYLSTFNASTQKFSNTKRVTSNSVYDYMPTAAISAGNPVVYYASCTDNNMANTSNTSLKKYIGGSTSTLKSSQNYILEITASTDGTAVTYLMDADGDTSNSSDVNAYTISGGSAKTTALGKPIADVVYADLDGTDTMIYTDKENIYYTDKSGTLQTIPSGLHTVAGGLYPVKTSTGLDMVWTVQNDNGTNSLWGMSYENGEWSQPVRISSQESKMSSISVTALNGKMYGVASSTDVTLESDGSITDGSTDLLAFEFTDFTDISVIDVIAFEEDFAKGQTGNFDVTVENIGTNDVSSITFTVKDELGTQSTQTVNVDLHSGETDRITLSYPVPQNYKKTKLSVTAFANGESDITPDNNTMSVDIGNTDLYFGDIETNSYENGYIITTKLYNASDITANKTAVNVIYNDKENDVDYIAEGESLAVNESIDVNIPVSCDDIEFDEDGIGYVYIYPSDKTAEDAECIVLQKTEIIKYTVEVSSENSELGTVSGGGIFEEGEIAEVSATPNNGYRFAGWYNGSILLSSEAEYFFAVKENIKLVAKFSRIPTVTFSESSVNVKVGNTAEVVRTINNPDNVSIDIKYGIKDKSIATITLNSGKYIVTGVKAGSTELHAIVYEKGTTNVLSKTEIPVTVENDGKVNSVSIGNIEMRYKDYAKINPVINADSGVKYNVEYKSSDTSVVTVDKNGNVYGAKKWGKKTATITCTVTDEFNNVVTDTCKVTVGFTWWQWIIGILLFGWIWY